VIERLRRMDYTGPLGLEVFNNDIKAQNPVSVAQRAMGSLRRFW
jgi:sugar phosphate isomerase/epimerase